MPTPERRTIVCDVSVFAGHPDAATIDTLARLQLALRPYGLEILFSGASPELAELIAFAGLADVLRVKSPPAKPLGPSRASRPNRPSH
jgi:hypothetical protein